MFKPTTAPHATATTCERCGAGVLRQKSGLPWSVTADAEHLTVDQARARTTPNQRAYCIRESKWTAARLVEASERFHSRQCPNAHVVEHACPPGTPAVRGALW